MSETAQGEWTRLALVGTILHLVGMAFPPLAGTLKEIIALWPQLRSVDPGWANLRVHG